MSNQNINIFSFNTPKDDKLFLNPTPAMPMNNSKPNNNLTTSLINISPTNEAKLTIYNGESINNNHEKNNKLDKALALGSTRCATLPLDDKCKIKINNIVALANSGCELNLTHIALLIKNAQYNPKKFNALIMRLKKPKSVALIFDSGKLIVTGTTNEKDSYKAARKFVKILKKCGFEVLFKSFQIINIVSSCNVNFDIALTKLNTYLYYKYSSITNKVSYEPEVFPGLIYRMEKPKITVLIFGSGKINFVGAKKQEDITEAYKKIYPLIVKFENKNKKKINDNEIEKSNYFNDLDI
jgi:transcription initiation factor TFIID TATA-box-binding protein